VVFDVVVRAQEAIPVVKSVVSSSPVLSLRWCLCLKKTCPAPFRLDPNAEDPTTQRLRHKGWSSFSHHLLQNNGFKSIHATVFTLNPEALSVL
jgi:hypothetical protein